MSDGMPKPRAYIDLTGQGTDGAWVHIILDYDRTQARIELAVKELLSDRETALDVYRRLLQRLGEACQEAALTPQGISWPAHRPKT